MKTFAVPVKWLMATTMHIDAETLEDAAQIAYDANLPDGDYVDNSFEVIEDEIEEE